MDHEGEISMTLDLNLFELENTYNGMFTDIPACVQDPKALEAFGSCVIDAVKKAFRGTCSFLKRFRASYA